MVIIIIIIDIINNNASLEAATILFQRHSNCKDKHGTFKETFSPKNDI